MDNISIGQLNLHNDEIATSELDRLILEQKLDIVLIQEQYQSARLRRNVVQLDCRSQAGIYVASSNFTVTSLRNLMTSHPESRPLLRSHPLPFLVGHKIIIGADVNASSSLWYGKLRSTDTVRRCAVEDFIAYMNLTIHNTPDAPPTFCNKMESLVPDNRPENDTDHHRQIRQWAIEPPLSPMSDLPSSDEFLGIIRSLPLNKASGDDKISNKMIKEACKLSGDKIFTVFKCCIAEGIFPRIWRCGNIRIIPKSGDKPPDDPKSYRPITLLPSLGKLLERLVVPRLLPGGVKFHNR
ncbi:unnamed protein product [Arctia plantaginis]|uniref:Reverse transcriptase n=1 Tax=Arctia plantaginis TaxID=874455 RepID=A0A8S1AYK7_ARCPL|nr:unnamed protein product [Arctia plantaginis]